MDILPIELAGQAIADALETHLEHGRKEYKGPGCPLCHRRGLHSVACRAPRIQRALLRWRDAVLLAADADCPSAAKKARGAMRDAGNGLVDVGRSVLRSSSVRRDTVDRCSECQGVINRTSFRRVAQHEATCHLTSLDRALGAWTEFAPPQVSLVSQVIPAVGAQLALLFA